MLSLHHLEDWEGNAQEALDLSAGILRTFNLESPTLRTLRFWRAQGVVSSTKARRYTEREVLEVIAVHLFQLDGQSLEAARNVLESLSLTTLRAEVEKMLSEVAGVSPAVLARAKESVISLALGILKEFEKTRSGQIFRQDENTSPEMRFALASLGRLYLEEGRKDCAASLHQVVERCTKPFEAWELALFRHAQFPYASLQLVEGDLHVPTLDCLELAQASGYSVDDIREGELFRDLQDLLSAGFTSQEKAYSAVRQFVAERSLITIEELREFISAEKLPFKLSRFLETHVYAEVPDLWCFGDGVQRFVYRCEQCGTLLRPHQDTQRYPEGRCPLPACGGDVASDRLDAQEVRVARPHVLSYWVNPAIDELRLYKNALAKNLDASLYPNVDQVDVALGTSIGIDVKAYRSPITLALRLNRTIGGLAAYKTRIVAVPDYIANTPHYLSNVRLTLEPKLKQTLKVQSISQVLSLFERLADEA